MDDGPGLAFRSFRFVLVGSVLVGSVAAGPEYRTPVGTRWEVPFFMPMAAMQYAATSEAKGHAGATTEVAAWPRLVSETCLDLNIELCHLVVSWCKLHAPLPRALCRAFCFRSVWFRNFRSFRSVPSVPFLPFRPGGPDSAELTKSVITPDQQLLHEHARSCRHPCAPTQCGHVRGTRSIHVLGSLRACVFHAHGPASMGTGGGG